MLLKDVRNISLGSQKVKAVWFQGKKLWPVLDDRITAFRGLIHTLHTYSSSSLRVSPVPVEPGHTSSTSVSGSKINQAIMWVVLGDRGVFTMSHHGKSTIRISRTGSALEVSSYSKESDYMKVNPTAPGSGPCLVRVRMDTQWYGYWFEAEVFDMSGRSLGKRDVGNGGAFTSSKTAFSTGTVTISQSDCAFYAYEIGGTRFPARTVLDEPTVIGYNAAAYAVTTNGTWAPSSQLFPIENLDVWLYAGGGGGSGSGSIRGVDGGNIKLTSVPSSGAWLTVGRGGHGGSGAYGASGGPGGATTFAGYSANPGGSRSMPVIPGTSYGLRNVTLGVGGEGGGGNTDGRAGTNGGLLAVYSWGR